MAIYYFRTGPTTSFASTQSWSLTDGGTAAGVIPTAADDAYFTVNSGPCTVFSAGSCKTLIFSGVGSGNYSNTFNLSNTLTVSGNITLSSTMTFTGSSTITINATSSITSNTKVFTCNLTISGPRVITLLDDVYFLGNVQTTGSVGAAVTFNGNTLYCAGNFGTFTIGMIINGSSNVTMNGTGIFSVSTAFSANFNISGTLSFDTTGVITINATSFYAGASGMTIRYVKGTVVMPKGQISHFVASGGGTLNLDLKGVMINGTVNLGTVGIISLLSDFVVDGGTIVLGSGYLPATQPLRIDNNGGNLYFGGNELPSSISGSPTSYSSGSAIWYFRGGGNCTFIGPSTAIILPTSVFDYTGTIKFVNGQFFGNEGSAIYFGGNFTYSFLNGNGKITSENIRGLKNQGRFVISSSCNMIGFDKARGIPNLSIANAATITMDKFFNGRPDCITNIFCSTSTGTYTITFQDTSEKFANWVKISNCILTRRGQLLVLNKNANTSTGRNVGVRFTNNLPNGAPVHSPTNQDPMVYGANGLVSDPTITL
jgi:hypothetical protein